MTCNMENRWHAVRQAASKTGAALMAAALAGALMVGAVGCTQANTVTASSEAATSAESSAEASGSTDAGTTTKPIAATTIDESLYDLDYSDRDKDASYDASKAVSVQLSGSTSAAKSDAVQSGGSLVTITQEGVYVLEGNFEGQVVVDAPEDAKVQLVLNGVDITNPTGSAIYVKQADKCFVTLADGTVNALSDSANYDLTNGDDTPDATLYSTCDLTLQGTGKLTVTAAYNDAVKTKDDLVVTGGTYEVEALGDGLMGKDSVKIADGTVNITATEGDGIKSNKDDSENKGFVSIDGGVVTVKAGDKGVNAVTYLRVEPGATVNVTAADDAFHCDGSARIDGGDITIDSGDDGVHVEYALEVNGGTINVKKCVEGLEGQTVTINDGAVDIVASDDGINAASPETSSTTDTASEASESPSAAETAPGASGQAPSGTMPDTPGDMPGGAAPDMQGAPSGAAPDMQDMPSGAAPDMQGMPNGGGQGNFGRMGGMGGMGGMMDTDESCVITINSGTITVQAEGDGVDSNGYVYVNGGATYVSGPTNSGNGSLDYGLGAEMNGGTFIAAGAMGMAESFTGGTQAFALVQASGSAGDTVSVTDASGEELASFEPTKQFQCVIVSAPGMADGQTYNLVVNGTATSFTASTTGAQAGMDGMGGQGGWPGMGGQGGPDGFGGNRQQRQQGQGGQGVQGDSTGSQNTVSA